MCINVCMYIYIYICVILILLLLLLLLLLLPNPTLQNPPLLLLLISKIVLFRERSCTYGVNQNGVHLLTTTHILYQTYTNPYHIPKIWTRLAFARYAHGFLRLLCRESRPGKRRQNRRLRNTIRQFLCSSTNVNHKQTEELLCLLMEFLRLLVITIDGTYTYE